MSIDGVADRLRVHYALTAMRCLGRENDACSIGNCSFWFDWYCQYDYGQRLIATAVDADVPGCMESPIGSEDRNFMHPIVGRIGSVALPWRGVVG